MGDDDSGPVDVRMMWILSAKSPALKHALLAQEPTYKFDDLRCGFVRY